MNADVDIVNKSGMQRPLPEPLRIPKNPEMIPAVPLGQRFNVGHQTTPAGFSLYPTPPNNRFYKSLTTKVTGNLWVDSSNTYEDGRLSTQPYHLEQRAMSAYSYDRRIPPGSYVEPVMFNLAHDPHNKTKELDRYQQAKLRREMRAFSIPRRGIADDHFVSCVFVGFVEWNMERAAFRRGELDRLMIAACRAKYPCSRPATYEEFISHAITGLPAMNQTKFDITFTGPGSEKIGPGALDHKNTLFSRKKIIMPGERLDGSTGQIEISDSSIWGKKACIAVVYSTRLQLQPSLRQFGQSRKTIKDQKCYTENCSNDKTQWHTFPHVYQSTNTIYPM